MGLSVSRSGDIVVAATGSVIHLLEAATGRLTRSIDTGSRQILRLEVAQYDGDPIAFATTVDTTHRIWSTRTWNLTTGDEIAAPKPYRLSHGEEDKPLYGLALSDGPRGLRFAFASAYRKVMWPIFRRRCRTSVTVHMMNCICRTPRAVTSCRW